MKTYSTLYALRLSHLFAILIPFCLLSCWKEKPILSNPSKATSSINFQVTGLSEPKEDNDKPIGDEIILKDEILPYGDADLLVRFSELSTENAEQTPNSQPSKFLRATQKAASSKLLNNTSYKVVLYKMDKQGNPAEYVAQADGKVGTTLSIPVEMNSKYSWFAYSFNNTSKLPIFSPSSPQLQVSVGKNQNGNDFIYQRGTLTTSNVLNGQNSININFDRKTAVIQLELNARGIFAPIDSAKVNISSNNTHLKSASFSILTGNFNNFTNASAIENTEWITEPATENPSNWVKQAAFQTVPDGKPLKLKIDLSYLRITSQRIVDQSPNTRVPVERVFPSKTIDFVEFTPIAGKRYKLAVLLLESAIEIGNARWARGNLYYSADPNTKENQYRIRYDNANIQGGNTGILNFLNTDYWNGRATPEADPRNDVDPCGLIFPFNTWKLPSDVQFKQLMAVTNPGVSRENQPNNAGWFLAWNHATTNTAGHPNGNLIFPAMGYRSGQNIILEYNQKAGSSDGNSKEMGDIGYYRTNNNLFYFKMMYRTSENNSALKAETTTILLKHGANIRCIR